MTDNIFTFKPTMPEYEPINGHYIHKDKGGSGEALCGKIVNRYFYNREEVLGSDKCITCERMKNIYEVHH